MKQRVTQCAFGVTQRPCGGETGWRGARPIQMFQWAESAAAAVARAWYGFRLTSPGALSLEPATRYDASRTTPRPNPVSRTRKDT